MYVGVPGVGLSDARSKPDWILRRRNSQSPTSASERRSGFNGTHKYVYMYGVHVANIIQEIALEKTVAQGVPTSGMEIMFPTQESDFLLSIMSESPTRQILMSKNLLKGRSKKAQRRQPIHFQETSESTKCCSAVACVRITSLSFAVGGRLRLSYLGFGA